MGRKKRQKERAMRDSNPRPLAPEGAGVMAMCATVPSDRFLRTSQFQSVCINDLYFSLFPVE